ncbi:MAG: hypothetical protein V8T01_09625 [Oscillospiraceae bacterium]
MRFRRGGESSIFAGSFFLSKLRPLCWVAVWGYEGTSGFGASLSFSSPGAAILFFLKEKNGGAKILQSFIHKRVWNVETGAVEKRLTDVSQRLLWTTL